MKDRKFIEEINTLVDHIESHIKEVSRDLELMEDLCREKVSYDTIIEDIQKLPHHREVYCCENKLMIDYMNTHFTCPICSKVHRVRAFGGNVDIEDIIYYAMKKYYEMYHGAPTIKKEE